jgi:signal transduction histidine kinase
MKRSVQDASLVLIAAGLGAYFLSTTVNEGGPWPVWVELAAGAATGALLVTLRRTRPVTLALILIPAGLVFAFPLGAFPVALFAVAQRRGARPAVVLGGLDMLLVATVFLTALGPTRAYAEAVVLMVLLHSGVVAAALLVRSHRLLVASFTDRARSAEEGQRLLVAQARLAERERIAREMHDVLAHRISLVAVHAGALEVRRDATAPDRAAAGVVRQCAYDALEDLRGVIGVLRTEEPEPPPAPATSPRPLLEPRSPGPPAAR